MFCRLHAVVTAMEDPRGSVAIVVDPWSRMKRADQQTVAALPQRYIPTLVYQFTDDQQSPTEDLERGLLVFRHGAQLSVHDESW